MESIDFTGLAARAVAGLHEVRACLLVSRDGLTLAALPEGGEDVARRALDRLDAVGQPERGFLVIGDEVWVVSRRGPYLGIVVAAATAKAGLLLDRLESTLRAAEEARLLAGSAGPGRPEIPRRPRTPLHREPRFDPTRSEVRPPNVFEEMARVVSVPDKEETQRSEPSVGEAAATTAWPHTIREPEAPNVGGPGSGSEPPTIIRPDSRPEPEETTVFPPEPEVEKPEFTAPEPEEPRVVAPEPEPEDPRAVAPEPEDATVVAPEREEAVASLEPEEAKVVAPEPEFDRPEFTAPEPEEAKMVTPEPKPEEPKDEVPEPETEAPAARDGEPEFVVGDPRLTPLEPEAVSEQEEKVDLPDREPQLAQANIDSEGPRESEPSDRASEPEAIAASAESVEALLSETSTEQSPVEPSVDSIIPEPKVPDFQEQLAALELSGSVQEPTAEPSSVEAVEGEEISASSEPEVSLPPMPRFAHPQREDPKAIPHYSPPEALLGEMGRVVAEESPPADILPPGVSVAGTVEAPSDTTTKDAAEPGGTKAREASKERGDETEVDPVALAREFSQLFDEPERNS